MITLGTTSSIVTMFLFFAAIAVVALFIKH